MSASLIRRVLSLLLTLCLLAPAAALGEATESEPSPADAWPEDSSVVTRSSFELGLSLHADAFPFDGQADYEGWEELLNKLSFSGTIDTQRLNRPTNRMYMEGSLNLNGKVLVPVVFEDYCGFRYIRSSALCGRSVHFQMNNYLEFMLKPYYYYGLPTQYLGLLTYPQATVYMLEAYEDPLAECFQGSGNRTVSYAELYELCEALDAIVLDDSDADQPYMYMSALLEELMLTDAVYDRLSQTTLYLDYLDPEQEGMSVVVQGDTETYAMNGRTLFTRTGSGDERSFFLSLPDPEDYLLELRYSQKPGANGGLDADARLTVSLEEDVMIDLKLEARGYPKEDDVQAIGSLRFSAEGSALPEGEQSYSFAYRLTRTAPQPPYRVTLGVDWIHPVTKEPAVTLLYQADIEMHDESVLEDHIYDNQNDFFRLNESVMEEYKNDFLPPLALSFAPLVLEIPAGAINDVLRFGQETGLLATLGVE